MRRRSLLGPAAAAPLMLLSLHPLGASAAGAALSPVSNPFDAYIASGDASCLELTVTVGGYSFIVQPDTRIPRATATISEGQSGALAAPADPGDSVDALPGLLFPREEGQLASGLDSAVAQTKVPVPKGVDAGAEVTQNPFNPTLEYPIEHANAQYPDPSSQSAQESTYLKQSSVGYRDPSGILTVDGTAGDATAGPSSAIADAGAGTATSVPLLGVSVGRVSSNATAQVTSTAVSDDVSCTMHDVTIAPPGSSTSLHIGSLHATLHTERALNGATATSSRSLQLADVTINGRNALQQTGAGGSIPTPQPNTFPQSPYPSQPPSACSLTQTASGCQNAPVLPAWIQSVSFNGTANPGDKQTSGGNQDAASMTAATVTLQSTAPVPATIPSGPPSCVNTPPSSGAQFQQWLASCLPSLNPSSPSSNLPITSAPTTYTLQLANLTSSTYGLVSPNSSLGFGAGAGFGAGGFGLGGGLGSGTIGLPSSPPARSTGASVATELIPAAIRWPVIGTAAAMEAALLGWLWLRRRAAQRGRLAPPARETFLDLP